MSKIKVRVVALLAVMALLLTLPAVASAQSVPPHIFIGTAFVNGLPANAGIVVTGMIGGEEQGSAVVSNNDGSYTLMVNQGAGTDVTFSVGTLTAIETAVWAQGEAELLDLTSSSFDPPSGSSDPGPIGGKGATGATGAAGPAGDVGPRGPAGSAGSGGTAGNDGAPGATGPAGPAGPAGPGGAAGASGSGGGGGAMGVIALILAIIALIGVGGVYFMSRRPA